MGLGKRKHDKTIAGRHGKDHHHYHDLQKIKP
jgi:hypothetical protein